MSMRNPNRGSRRSRRTSTVSGLLWGVLVVIWAFPTYWMVNSSFKTRESIVSSTPQFVPFPVSLENYVAAFQKSGFVSSLLNSLFISIVVVLFSIGLGFLAAAALTRYQLPGRRALLIAVLAVQMIPAIALLIPLFLTFKNVGLLNTYTGLILAILATVLPFSIWILRAFFNSIPAEIEEAARVDGASDWRVLRSIYFPLVAPGIVTTSVFAFIVAWNDYITAYVMLQDQAKYTLPVWLVSFNTETGVDYGGLIAGSVIFAVPVVIFFLLVQRHLVAGMSAGAVKG